MWCAFAGLFCALALVCASTAAPVPKAAAGPPRVLVASVGEPGKRQLHLVDPATGEAKRLTDKGDNTEPAWSPDGKRIAFRSDRGGAPDIWLMNADGSEPKQLTKKCGGCDHLRWSPDGKRIAYRNAGPDGRGLSVVDIAEVATGAVTRLADGVTPEWSPDGKRLAYSVFEPREFLHSLHVVRADGSGARKLDTGAGAVWSPNGGRLAYTAFTGQPAAWRLYVIDADGANQKEIGSAIEDVRWSPDGRRLCFRDQVDGRPAVVVMNADGTGRELVAPAHESGAPRWSPDGRSLSYLRRAGEGKPVMLVVSEPDGKSAKELLSGVEAAAEWKPK